MKLKRIVSPIICITMLLIFSTSGYVQNNENQNDEQNAPISFNQLGIDSKLEEAEKSGHRYAYCYVDGTKYVSKNCNVTHSGGSNKWYFTEYEGIGATRSLSTKIEIDKKYWNMEDNSTVAVTIFYYDLGDSLYRIYAYGDDWNDFALRGYLRGTCEKRWKTQTYYWDDFKNNIKENCDLNIASSFKNENVGIGGIFIEENRKEYGLDVTPENGYYGRIFSYGESDYMNFVCNNSNNSKVSSEITYTVKNNEGRILKTGRTERFDVEAGKEKEIQFETGVKDCGTYTITYGVKSITSEGTEEEYERTRKFSISQTLSEGEKRSDLLGMCYNFAVLNNNTKRDSSINQLLRFGIGSVRNDERWRMAELTEGVFTDEETTSRNRSQLIDNGIEYMGIAYSCPDFYNNNQGGGYYPDTEEALNAFKNYIKYLADKGIGYIEVFNEPNHPSYMTSGIGPSGVVKYCKAAREGVNASNHPETKLVAGSTAGFSRDFLDPFIKEGGMRYVDYLSYHPYQYPNFSVSKLIKQAEQMQKLMVETDGVAKPIILSEMGWSTAEDQATTGHGIPEEKRRQYVPVMYISAQASQKFETINYYCYNNIGTRLEEREDRFGLIEFPDGINSGAASDTFIGLTAYADFLADGTINRSIIKDNYCTAAYEFKRPNKENIAAIFSTNGSETLALNLGCESVRVYDMYGNDKGVLKSNDGIYSFDLADEVFYIEGNFKSFEESNVKISQNSVNITALQNDGFTLTYKNTANKDLNVEIDCDEKIFRVGEQKRNSDGEIQVTMYVSPGVDGLHHLDVKITDGDDMVYYNTTAVTIGSKAIAAKFDTVQTSNVDSSRWEIEAYISNLSNINMVSGECELLEPNEFKGGKRVFYDIQPNETRTLRLALPELIIKRPEKVKIRIKLDNGYDETFEQKVDFTAAEYADDKPVLDGIISPGEWKGSLLGENRQECARTLIENQPWSGIDDLSFNLRYMWDEDNLYMLTKVRDDVFWQEEEPDTMWSGDSVQLAILEDNRSSIEASSLSFTELTIAKTKGVETIYRHSGASGQKVGEVKNFEGKIGRSNGYTIYEFKIPWNEILKDGHKAKKGDIYCSSMLVNDNDGRGRKSYMFYNDGIGGSKNAALFGKLELK